MSVKSFVMPSDMSDLCRVCLQLPEESQYLDLTTIYDEDDNLTYGECFTICTQIDLSADEDVPHHLCKPCGLELQMSYDFYKKIEESNRVIEQYKNQTKLQENTSEQTKTFNLDDEEDELTDEEEQLPEPAELTEDECVIKEEDVQDFIATADVVDETEEIDVDMCETEANTHQQLNLNKNNSSLETTNVENIKIHVQDQVEVDYQNFETLEEEETETLQINCDENSIPIHVTKIKTLEIGENEEYFEYAEIYDDDDEEEEEGKEPNKVYTQKTHEPDTDERLRWQDNVVAVANKEHLPIVIDDDCVEDGEEESTYKTSKFKSKESLVMVNDSSHDEAIYDENETTDDAISQTAKRKSNANKNINNNNSTERKRHVGSYSCDYCHRVYPNYSRMKNHRRCHEADRPKFSCSHCGRLYATKQARDCHIQTAHDKSGYTCSICSKVFAIRKSLEIHVRYHTGDFPYACKLCDRKFAQACHLNTHINVKHNQIRFSCEYPNCGKYFTSSSSLRNHEFTHGIMPFECEYCQQGYPAKSKLRIHIQRKHGIVMNTEQLEKMRKFHVMRSKVNLVQFVDT